MTDAAMTGIFPSNRVGRQTFFVASVMVLLGLGLGVYVNTWWLLLALMPGIGMMVTALSGFCPMSWMLARMPWNGSGRSGTCCGG
ncbi:MAG: DUF2892 domain-containing protein [Phycisphaeraceae bacterium]|nr:DUF2892 domain-containing protein [Phycisphaeraceae bacterium]